MQLIEEVSTVEFGRVSYTTICNNLQHQGHAGTAQVSFHWEVDLSLTLLIIILTSKFWPTIQIQNFFEESLPLPPTQSPCLLYCYISSNYIATSSKFLYQPCNNLQVRVHSYHTNLVTTLTCCKINLSNNFVSARALLQQPTAMHNLLIVVEEQYGA